ncbi:DUF2225 domain-containing protein, partial [Rhizobium leguminosarum]|nr:DUF2225 domain-containing protein [Rhizobium leguminosarum]
VYCKGGKHEEALEYYTQALEIFQGIYIESHPFTAAVLKNIGDVYCKRGKHEEALEYYKRVLQMRQDIYTRRNHHELAAILSSIGNVYCKQGKHEQALKHLKKALKMYQQLLEICRANYRHRDVSSTYEYTPYYIAKGIAITLNSIGKCYRAMGSDKEAVKYYEQILEIKGTRYLMEPDYFPKSTSALVNIGDIYSNLGEYSKTLTPYT